MADQSEKKSLFREKSLERIESPEKLNDYLKVTSPGVWLVLSIVIALLIGACIWGALGKINTTVKAAVVSQDGSTECLVPEEALSGVIEYKTVTIDGEAKELQPSTLEPTMITEDTNVYVLLAGDLSFGDVVYPISLTEELPDGIYSGQVVTETLSPMSLLFN